MQKIRRTFGTFGTHASLRRTFGGSRARTPQTPGKIGSGAAGGGEGGSVGAALKARGTMRRHAGYCGRLSGLASGCERGDESPLALGRPAVVAGAHGNRNEVEGRSGLTGRGFDRGKDGVELVHPQDRTSEILFCNTPS